MKDAGAVILSVRIGVYLYLRIRGSHSRPTLHTGVITRVVLCCSWLCVILIEDVSGFSLGRLLRIVSNNMQGIKPSDNFSLCMFNKARAYQVVSEENR